MFKQEKIVFFIWLQLLWPIRIKSSIFRQFGDNILLCIRFYKWFYLFIFHVRDAKCGSLKCDSPNDYAYKTRFVSISFHVYVHVRKFQAKCLFGRQTFTSQHFRWTNSFIISNWKTIRILWISACVTWRMLANPCVLSDEWKKSLISMLVECKFAHCTAVYTNSYLIPIEIV